MEKLRKHWPAVVGWAGLLLQALRALADGIGYVDTALEHIPGRDHSWLAGLERMILQPPWWLILAIIAAGLALIYWDYRRNPRVVDRHHHHLQAETGRFSTVPVSPPHFKSTSAFEEMRRAGLEESRLHLATLRGEGVSLRNEGANAIFSDAQWAEWREKLVKWNSEVVKETQKINKADAQWFAILDTVPPPRIRMESIFASDQDRHVYAMHDFRLTRLEKLIDQYRGRA